MNRRVWLLGASFVLPLLLLLGLTSWFSPATHAGVSTAITVDTLDDELNNDGDCSLREAITAANDNLPVDACLAGDAVLTDTITFNVAGTITLTEQLSITAGGPVMIDGGEVITVSGGGALRVFWVSTGALFTLQDIVIADGFTEWPERGGGLYNTGGNVHISNATFFRNFSSGWCDPIDGLEPGEGSGIANEGVIYINNTAFLENYHDDLLGCSFGGGTWNTGIMTIENSIFRGNTSSYGGGIYNWGTMNLNNAILSGNTGFEGGGIYNWGTMNLNNATLSGNTSDYGGGIVNGGIMILNNATLSGNTSDRRNGGGIANLGTMNLNNATLSGNTSGQHGGGIANLGTMNLNNATLSGNTSDRRNGGGIANLGTMNLNNATLSGNTSGQHGGGIVNAGTMILNNATLSGNTSGQHGGGVYNWGDNTPITMTNSIIAASANEDCFGTITSLGHNIAGDNSCALNGPGDMNNTDPLVGPLQDNGGDTWTHALLYGSPAIDAANPPYCPATDQRGVYRPQDGNGDGIAICDIGSYEYIKVDIDIQPADETNIVNCYDENSVIEVALLTTPEFDAMTVVHTTVDFEGASELHKTRGGEVIRHEVDVDHDGETDLLFHFRYGDTTLTCDATQGTLMGETFDGQVFEGSDMIGPPPRGGGD